ncbi:tRNA preQ1(34) S-adenosylmethionine ribosyltransferase-isomerase QueA [Rhodoblastus acidophilus]|uniref:S-adenosylmethionine:tRNA ribosyltransferase-isomerase n=1 Tax=Candidatus Rhodoblastus alkanivorans TaxID=2954117 RepID=A0ABS9Z7J8_9HYPH|nr:tRNA preQ1(34) S-adenosylmethionine ribosyltransferase-isomerase QueA [Candidatus Rhodoblastus alkanivorans]MCI4678341.1 tRNA preQ1(34) S-adenosylmethionine ribosyltransferase-isomerase QueA [Candidatus Rhodoblastus alkanivorans]MCI4683599.1 tRNA preQ1(34) S-adenosylmethionine ribosyltransferase-isomerase QueA [Candidatus Rhodoblastus alkanivorans]MDI4640915.1 tRNA preQ1(34) S-adenosylmethionine ribosyltransferase-isomerase QueA [Rhodoblastus acidophilus]
MRVDLFDFDLPEGRIALRPAEPRDSARLLAVTPDSFRDASVRDLPAFLRPGDVLVVNDARVIPAQLFGWRRRGEAVARIEATLHKREDASHWRAFVRPAKKLKPGEKVIFGEAREGAACLAGALWADVAEKNEGEALLSFNLSGPALDDAIFALGHMPLPPYIASRRADDDRDARDYQTLFADKSGAVAAPTAGLHFTPELVEAVRKAGATLEKVTLLVGAGTFLPVKAEDTAGHVMHAEWGSVDAQVAARLNAARAAGGRIVAVGTTSLRILESAADPSGVIRPFAGETSIFITPGYEFRAVDALMTNFHLPRSTLFMLVSAFSGLERMQAAYAHAIEANYRFYSYGDACLLLRG